MSPRTATSESSAVKMATFHDEMEDVEDTGSHKLADAHRRSRSHDGAQYQRIAVESRPSVDSLGSDGGDDGSGVEVEEDDDGGERLSLGGSS